jgi:hypothetical protein
MPPIIDSHRKAGSGYVYVFAVHQYAKASYIDIVRMCDGI